ncbi:MAG: FAD:protein FMN transferase [Erysipelotrichaceae bacterium]|nr:FAD:protein FMN transferase [Erysipelotrichaceae bacterium]
MKKLLISMMVLFLLLGCSPKMEKYSASSLGFDTVITLIGYTKSESEFNKYFEQMKKEFEYYNQLFDKYNTYEGINNLKTINDQAGKQPVIVDDAIIELLLLAKEFYTLTDGAFDATMGATMNIWHEYRENGQTLNGDGNANPPIPTIQELEASRIYSGWEYVEIDEINKTVFITNENVSLDVGGIAKGFATEKAAQALEKAGLYAGAINGGGNVRLIGTKPNNDPWATGIGNPNDLSSSSVTIVYTDGGYSIVTSGDYQRYYMSNGIRYGHIIDPNTLYPAKQCRSVSIVTKNSGYADILSTALFVMDLEKGMEFIETFNATHPDDEVGAVWLYDLDQKAEGAIELNGFAVVATENLKSQLKGFGK